MVSWKFVHGQLRELAQLRPQRTPVRMQLQRDNILGNKELH